MDYSELADVYESLESTQSNLEKTSILAKAFSSLDKEELEKVVRLSMGRVFAAWKDKEIGISSKLMVKAISKATGEKESDIEDLWRETGDLGLTAERLVKDKKQQTLAKQELTVEKVFMTLQEMATYEGSGSQEKKLDKAAELLSSAEPREARYITRTIIGDMRVGVGEGTVRDAIAEAFFPEEEKEEVKSKIQHAYDMANDFSVVARTAKEEGFSGLEEVEMELFRPIQMMLAQKAEDMEDGFESVGGEEGAVLEYKYDGMRVQIHKKGDEVKVFTRRLEDVTEQFPDIVDAVRKNVDAQECVLDGEAVAYNPEDMSNIPFQKLSKRIKRKYGIEEMVEEIPVVVHLFDVLYLEGDSFISKPLEKRWSKLKEVVEEAEYDLDLAKHLETSSIEDANSFYQEALQSDAEGIMMKNPDAEFKPGSRVGYMVKLKPVMETLDLVVVGAEWGEGRRSDWLGSYRLACRDEDLGEFKVVGKMATGFTDEQLEEMTEKIKPLITKEEGREVDVKPDLVVEVSYEELQKSPQYSSGYALRFPRLVQIREDLGVEGADTLSKVSDLYESQ